MCITRSWSTRTGGGSPRRFVEVPDRTGVDVLPAGAEHHSDGVFAGVQLPCDVVGDVEIAAVVAGVAGVELVVTDLYSVEAHIVVAEAADVGACTLDPSLERERSAK